MRHSSFAVNWRAVSIVILCGASIFGACAPKTEQIRLRPLDQIRREGHLTHDDLGTYGVAFVYRQGRPGGPTPPTIWTDQNVPAGATGDDTNLIIFVEGSGDELKHFRRTARLLAESKYHPPNDNPNLLIVLVHWSETTNVVREHLNFKGQSRGAELLRRFCKIHQMRHPDGKGFLGIIGFSAGTRVTQLALGAVLPEGRAADRPPRLTGVPAEMKYVDNIVYLGSSINRDDPLPFHELRGRFINFVNHRDTHYGDQAPYFAPAGTSPLVGRVVQANLYLARPGTGASANGFAGLPVITTRRQFELIDKHRDLKEEFRLVNVCVPVDLLPLSPLGIPLLDDSLDTYRNLAPNHYSMVGRGPRGTLESLQFDQYKDLSFEFVREQVASAVMHGRVYTWELTGDHELTTPSEEIPQEAFQLRKTPMPEGAEDGSEP
jgi:hypothetical protein